MKTRNSEQHKSKPHKTAIIVEIQELSELCKYRKGIIKYPLITRELEFTPMNDLKEIKEALQNMINVRYGVMSSEERNELNAKIDQRRCN
jgi:hypothetical protein